MTGPWNNYWISIVYFCVHKCNGNVLGFCCCCFLHMAKNNIIIVKILLWWFFWQFTYLWATYEHLFKDCSLILFFFWFSFVTWFYFTLADSGVLILYFLLSLYFWNSLSLDLHFKSTNATHPLCNQRYRLN